MAYKSPGQVSQGKFSRRSLLKTTAAGVVASPLTGLSLASGRNDEGASHTRPETSSVVLRQEAKMAHSDELAYADVTEIARGIRQRQFSPVEVMNAFIARIEVRNPSLNALVYQGFDQARESAKDAEKALTDGRPLGPLHGVPVAIKDLFDFKPGWITTFGGIRAMRNFKANFYCGFAERIEQAGAIILGKTNSPIMGFRGTCDNYLFGPTRNPFNMTKNTGGSSGGSAAAVADGLLPLAEGTDGGGSIRIPAAW